MIEPLEKTAAVRSGDSRSRLMIDNQIADREAITGNPGEEGRLDQSAFLNGGNEKTEAEKNAIDEILHAAGHFLCRIAIRRLREVRCRHGNACHNRRV
jgi:hypothetical protein